MKITDLCIDSRNRDVNMYNSPNKYIVQLPIVYKDVYSIEIHRMHIPQTQWIIDDHNNIFYYKVENKEDSICITCDKINLLYQLNKSFDPSLLTFSQTNGHLSIHNNYKSDIICLFSKKQSIGNVLGIPYDITIKAGSTFMCPEKMCFQHEPCVFICLNGYSNMENVQNDSLFHKHLFGKQHQSRQIKEFTPELGKLSFLDISFYNFNNVPYNFHGFNHTFNLRIKEL